MTQDSSDISIIYDEYNSFITRTNSPEGRPIIVKEIRDSRKELSFNTICELHCLHILRDHPRFVQILDVNYEANRVRLILSSHQGDINLLHKRSFTERLKIFPRLMNDIFLMLYQLYQYQILHLDIKSANILFDEDNDGIKFYMADFGISYQRPKSNTEKVIMGLSRYASIYRSPEILVEDKHYSYPAELWATGCLLTEFIITKYIFPVEKENNIDNIVEKSKDPSTIVSLHNIAATYNSLDILSLFKESLSIQEILSVSEYIPLLESLLQINPLDRPHIASLIKDKSDIISTRKITSLRPYPLAESLINVYGKMGKWIASVCKNLELPIRTFIASVDILERYLSNSKWKNANEILLACVCLTLCDNILSPGCTCLTEFIRLSEGKVCERDIKDLQIDVMKSLDYIIVSPDIDDIVLKLEEWDNPWEIINNVYHLMTKGLFISIYVTYKNLF